MNIGRIMDSNKKIIGISYTLYDKQQKYFCPIQWYDFHLDSSFTDNSMIFTPQSCKHIETRDPLVKK